MDMPQFGEILAELRQDRGMTQQELSAKLHVAKSSISNLETGQRRAHTELICKAAEVFRPCLKNQGRCAKSTK